MGRTFDFRHDALASLSARIRHIQVRETGQTQRKVELSLELHYDAWIRMDTERWFGMSVGSIADAVRGYALQALLPVRVEIGLRSTAYGFVPTGLDVDATAAAMATELQQQSGALLQENLWLWLSVLQERAYGSARVFEGFFSIYHE